jgi:hypothetical protein
MKKPAMRRRRFLLGAALGLAGCQVIAPPVLTDAQQSELNAHAGLYHICVARMAARMDDGRSPVTRIAGLAVDYCRPQAAQVAGYLDTINLPAEIKLHYLSQLSDTAARESANMLRQRRQQDSQPVEI